MAKRAELHLVLPDAHYGHVNEDESAFRARKCALLAAQYLAKERPITSTVILGDWLDLAAFSSYSPSTAREAANRSYIETEVKPCQIAMDAHQELCKSMVFLEGNHEFRHMRYLLRTILRGPVDDIARALAPKELLSRRADGKARKSFTWIPYGGPNSFHMIAPGFASIHGWTFSKNAASAHAALALGVSIIHGDTHRRQEYTGRHPITKQLFHAMSPGCLGPLDPDYMGGKPNNHSHGFAIIYKSATNPLNWTHYLVSIKDGYCVLPDGKEIQAK